MLIRYVGPYGELTQPVSAQVPMIHSIPGIRVSQEVISHCTTSCGSVLYGGKYSGAGSAHLSVW